MSGKRFWLTAIILALLLFAGFWETAFAHNSYSRKIKSLSGPHGESLILERFYGDGILGPDPYRVQLVNENKVILAYAETDANTAVYCPTIKFCWVFPYHSLLVHPWRLDYKHLDYRAISQDKSSDDDLVEPIYGVDHIMGFVQGPAWIKVFSPVIIAYDDWLQFLWVTGILFIPAFIAAFYRRKVFQQDLSKKKNTIVGILLLALYAIFCLFIGVVLLINLDESLIFALIFWGAGLVLGDGFAKWLIQKDLKKITLRK